MERYYLDGIRVRLRALEPEDVEFLCEIENCPANWDVSNFSVLCDHDAE